MCLDFPELQSDYKFSNAVGINYHNDNVFEEIKQNELEAKRIASFTAKKGILKDDGSPFFSTEYLIRKELRMSENEIESNEDWFKFERKEEESEAAAAPQDATAGMAGDVGGAAAPPTEAPSAAAQ